MSRDLSPISIKALKNFFNPYVLIAIDGIDSVRRFSTLCRIGGMGYKGLSNLDKKGPKRFEQVWCMRIKKDFPSMEWWLGRGYPLDPYLKGVMVDYLRSAMKPKDLRIPPEDVLMTSNTEELLEYSLLQRWLKKWLDDRRFEEVISHGKSIF